MNYENTNFASDTVSDETETQHTSDDLRKRISMRIAGAEEPMTVHALATSLNCQEREVYIALTEMVKNGEISVNERPGRSRVYYIPGRSADAPEPDPDERPGRTPFEMLAYVQVEDHILNAIDAGCCTLPQMKRHAGFEARDDLSAVIEGMLIDNKIEKVDNGNVTGYFRTSRMPKRFWLDGDRCGIEWPDTDAENERKQRLIAEKQAEIDARPRSASPAQIPEPKARPSKGYYDEVLDDIVDIDDDLLALDDEPDLQTVDTMTMDELDAEEEPDAKTPEVYQPRKPLPHSHSPKGINYSVELFRDAHDHRESKTDLARRLGVTAQAVHQQLKKNPAFMAAFTGTAVSEDATPQPPKRKVGAPASHLNLTDVENAAANFRTVTAAARSLGISPSHLYNKLKDADVAAAFDRGLERRRRQAESTVERYEREKSEAVEPEPLPFKPFSMGAGEIIADEVEDLAFRGIAKKEAARRLKMHYDAFKDHTLGRRADRTIHDAWQRGLERRQNAWGDKIVVEPKTPVPAFEGPIERFPIAPQSGLMMDIEETDLVARPDKPQTGSFAETKLGDGGLVVAFTGNFFALTKTERELLNSVAELMQGHGRETP